MLFSIKRLCIIFFSFLFQISVAQQFNFTTFGVEDGLPQSTVYEIFQDADGYLWIGTDGGGLCRYDGFRFKVFGKPEGLNGNVVKKVIQDKTGNLWIATNNGLHIYKDGKYPLSIKFPTTTRFTLVLFL